MNLFLVIFTLLIFSCKERINLDLSENANKLTIEAEVDDEPGPYYVKISRSVAFNTPGGSIPYNVDFVTLADNLGNMDTLKKVSDGIYQTNSIQGKIGNTYYVKVVDQNNVYSAVSKLNAVPDIDSIYVSYFLTKDNRDVLIRIKDPENQENYYRYFVRKNNKNPEIMYIFEDKLINGTTWRLSAFREDFALGDSVEFFLLGIDKQNYNYFNVLLQTSTAANGGNQSAAPINPTSNFNGDILGYFSAHSKKRAKFVINK